MIDHVFFFAPYGLVVWNCLETGHKPMFRAILTYYMELQQLLDSLTSGCLETTQAPDSDIYVYVEITRGQWLLCINGSSTGNSNI